MADQIRREVAQGCLELWHKMTWALGTGATAEIAMLTVMIDDPEGLQRLQCSHDGDRWSQRAKGIKLSPEKLSGMRQECESKMCSWRSKLRPSGPSEEAR